MKPLYVIHYSLFKGGRVLNRYNFFETKEKLERFLLFLPQIKDNMIIFKNIDLGSDKE